MKKRNTIKQTVFTTLCAALTRDQDLLKAAPPRSVEACAARYEREFKIPIASSSMERALEFVGLTTLRQASRRRNKTDRASKPEPQQQLVIQPPQSTPPAPEPPIVEVTPQAERATLVERVAQLEKTQKEHYAEFRIWKSRLNKLWTDDKHWTPDEDPK